MAEENNISIEDSDWDIVLINEAAAETIGFEIIEQTKDDQIKSLEKHIALSQSLKENALIEKDKIIIEKDELMALKDVELLQKDKELLSLLEEYHKATRFGEELKFKCTSLEQANGRAGEDVKSLHKLIQERDELVGLLNRRITEKDFFISEKEKELLALRKEYNDKLVTLRSCKDETQHEKDKIINEKERELLSVRVESNRASEALRAEVDELRARLDLAAAQNSKQQQSFTQEKNMLEVLKDTEIRALKAEADEFRRRNDLLQKQQEAIRKEYERETNSWRSKTASLASLETMAAQSAPRLLRVHEGLSSCAVEAMRAKLHGEGISVKQHASHQKASSSSALTVGQVVPLLEESLIDLQSELIPLISKLLSVPAPSSSAKHAPAVVPAAASASASSHAHASAAAAHSDESSSRICLSNFAENDVLIFFPTPTGDLLAFNVCTPHHYLSAESKSLIGQDKFFKKAYVLGKLIFKEQHVSSAEYNPFKLPVGVTFYEVHVESVSAMLENHARIGSIAAVSQMKK